MPPMISASAPTRIDLAGGTLDIWPLCHLLGRPATTVNLAIDLRAHVSVEERGDGTLEIVSEDKDEAVQLPVDALEHDQLGLATRLVEWFGPGDGLTIRLKSMVPPQSGLGGSSALFIALAGALGKLRDKAWERATIQNIETTVLDAPTGYQDYYPPLLGGANRLVARADGVHAERIEGGVAFLGKHLALFDTCIEHHSGLTNWEVVRRFLDGDRDVRGALTEIAAVAERMADAVATQDLAELAQALDDEWRLRRRLSPFVTNERIDALIGEAEKAGALAAKVCGAGGGGCVVFVVEDAEKFELAAARVAFAPDPEGLRVG